MKALRKFLKSLRVFKRIRLLEQKQKMLLNMVPANGNRISDIEQFIASREPCTTCGHHRYRQKTIHYDGCSRGGVAPCNGGCND